MIRDFIKECLFFKTKDKTNIIAGVLLWLLFIIAFCLIIFLTLNK